MLAAGVALFLLTTYVLKPLQLPGAIGVFINGHLIDLVGGCAFCAYTNLLFDLVHPQIRLHSPWICAAYLLCCGLFWEYVSPYLIKASVSDPLDVVCYVLGSLIYCAINFLGTRNLARGGG